MMDIFIAKQPIYDVDNRVYAYELLYRSGEENVYNCHNQDKATSTVIMNSFVSIGMKSLTDGKRAFINFSKKLIASGIPFKLPKNDIVIEILEDIIPDEGFIDDCKSLKETGYLLAIDDLEYCNIDRYKCLIQYIDIIKVDFLLNTFKEIELITKEYSNKAVKLLAEKIENKQQFKFAKQLGFDYFQGYYFEKPTIIKAKVTDQLELSSYETISELDKRELDINVLSSIVEHIDKGSN